MKAKKIVRYRIPVSQVFPATHPRAGEPTYFPDRIHGAIEPIEGMWKKLHTIRANYELWAKRFEKINRGEAVLQLYYWRGKPYRSKTATICLLSKNDGIGIQKVNLYQDETAFIRTSNNFLLAEKKWSDLAKNDGLSLDDFKVWFKGYDLNQSMAIIHFTKFRY